MSLYPELDHLMLDQLTERFDQPPVDGWQYAAVYFQEVACQIKNGGPLGVAFLFDRLAPPPKSASRLRGILCALAFLPSNHPAARQVFFHYLRDKRPLVVHDAINGLEAQEDRDAHDAVLALRDHPSPYVRGAVLRSMSRLFLDEALPMLYAALHDPDYIVRESAVDAFDDQGVVGGLPAVRPLLHDSHSHVRQAAQWMVSQNRGNALA